jgi:hypothetical protein
VRARSRLKGLKQWRWFLNNTSILKVAGAVAICNMMIELKEDRTVKGSDYI